MIEAYAIFRHIYNLTPAVIQPMEETKNLIIGAGLAGLTAAYELHKAGKPFLLLEARDRIGGRILTSRVEGDGPLELGPPGSVKSILH